jgi:hypothetical protein
MNPQIIAELSIKQKELEKEPCSVFYKSIDWANALPLLVEHYVTLVSVSVCLSQIRLKLLAFIVRKQNKNYPLHLLDSISIELHYFSHLIYKITCIMKHIVRTVKSTIIAIMGTSSNITRPATSIKGT